jgi:periplasmic protein TonB
MSYKALLFCPDERTARTVTQVLSELDFQVEICNEPFATVKKLTAEHFDAIVVDCENEQNATLLFKSARNSGSNQASLSIAVVEGQAGVAKAFRIGANLVLTKPINVEQSKGTIRVARGLLRKSEAAKAATAPGSQPGQISAGGSHTPASPVSTATPAPTFEFEDEPEPKPAAADAALLESMPDPAAHLGRAAAAPAAAKTNSFQPISQPMATALRDAADATGHSGSAVAQASPEHSSFPASASGSGAAPAPAREKAQPSEEMAHREVEPPSFSSFGVKPAPARSFNAGAVVKPVLIAAVVLLMAAGGYVGWKKTHYQFIQNLIHRPAPKAQPVQAVAPPAAVPVSTPASASPVAPTPSPDQIAIPTAPTQMDTEASSASLPSIPDKPAAAKELPAPKPRKAQAPVASSEENSPTIDPSESNALPVKRGEKVVPPAPQPAPEAAAPGALSVAPDTQDGTISGLTDVSPAVPHTAPQTLKVSQGVSQGLLVKKVAPVYPEQALQMKIQGAVEIMATISKDGNITNMKVLNGDAILAQAAMEAVKQWKYNPYYLDSQPVEIQTQITVNFKLPY